MALAGTQGIISGNTRATKHAPFVERHPIVKIVLNKLDGMLSIFNRVFLLKRNIEHTVDSVGYLISCHYWIIFTVSSN